MASDAHRHRQAARSVIADAREALDAERVDPRRWTYLAFLEAVALEAVAMAGLDADLTFEWPQDARTYTRRILVHAAGDDRVLRTAYIVEPDPSLGRGMTRVWMGGAATPNPASRMIDAEVASWTNENAAAYSVT